MGVVQQAQQISCSDVKSMHPGNSGGQLLVQPADTARISPWTLMFDNATLEQGFRQHQQTVWTSNELRNLMINLVAGVINFSITVSLWRHPMVCALCTLMN
jgi:hypothetical protein